MHTAFQEIAQHYDMKTVEACLLLSKDIKKELEETDIWRVKFEQEFPNCAFHPWWTSEQNYKLQKKYKGNLCLWVNDVDHILYKYCPIRQRLIDLHRELIHSGLGYGVYKQIPIDLTQAGECVVLRGKEFNGMEYYCTTNSKEEALSVIRENYSKMNEGRNTDFVCKYVVVKLSDLSLDKEKLDNINKKNSFWFFFLECCDDLEELV